MKEKWLPFPEEEYSNLYEVSNMGKVRRKGGEITRSDGKKRKFKRRLIKQQWAGPKLQYRKYLTVVVSRKSRVKRYSVHRLIAKAFLGNPPSKNYEVNHIDCDKSNNCSDNLEWLTSSENKFHAVDNGLMKKGEDSHHAILNERQVFEMRKIRTETGKSYKLIGDEFGVSGSAARSAILGITWRHLS